MTPLARLAYAIAAAVILLDQAVKFWVLSVFHLADKVSVQVLGPFWLSLVWNQGVSYGFLNGAGDWTRWALSIFAVGVAVALGLWVRWVDRLVLALAIGLIIGGALGNVIDRVRLGAVTDFLDFSRLGFPWVFNVADSGVSIGAVLLVWDTFLAPRKRATP
ncbi:MAG TPA: signal peptidase II [Caulobacteraceae bacterium]|jgi:signal peptidase II